MKTLRIALLSAVVFALAAPASAQVKGWGLGAGVFDVEFAVQARKDFWLGGDISEITGQAGVYFAGKTTFFLDADYHFNLKATPDSRFYPLAGVHFAFNSNDAKFGVNGGGGFQFMLTDKLAGFAEVKYTFFGWDGWGITGGFYF
jgi:opacity protein-like surface antigen